MAEPVRIAELPPDSHGHPLPSPKIVTSREVLSTWPWLVSHSEPLPTPHPGPPPQGGREAERSPPPLWGRVGWGVGQRQGFCRKTAAECLAACNRPELSRFGPEIGRASC